MLRIVSRIVPKMCGREILLGNVFFVVRQCPERDFMGQKQSGRGQRQSKRQLILFVPRARARSDGSSLGTHH